MIIKKDLYKILLDKIEKGKVIVLYWPRKSRKTFLLKQIIKDNFLNTY